MIHQNGTLKFYSLTQDWGLLCLPNILSKVGQVQLVFEIGVKNFTVTIAIFNSILNLKYWARERKSVFLAWYTNFPINFKLFEFYPCLRLFWLMFKNFWTSLSNSKCRKQFSNLLWFRAAPWKWFSCGIGKLHRPRVKWVGVSFASSNFFSLDLNGE